jgi:hypothetical protein
MYSDICSYPIRFHPYAWFANVKAWCAVRHADKDRNGFVDDCEMESLVEFAENELGFPISKEPSHRMFDTNLEY